MQEHILDSCTLCPRTCRVNRSAGQLGYCRAGADLIAARAALHHWEEPSISGERIRHGFLFRLSARLRLLSESLHRRRKSRKRDYSAPNGRYFSRIGTAGRLKY